MTIGNTHPTLQNMIELARLLKKSQFQIQEHFEIMAILNMEEEITLEEEQERALQEQMDIGKS